MDFSRILIGRRLANEEGQARKITAIEGVPAMGLDGLGSSAYGPEAALTVLIPLGAEGLHLIRPIMAAILFLLALLYFSYRQTIEAYPSTGGSYIVAKDNLGANAGLLAGSALMIDYVLNVAVGISAGIGALTSAIPPLHPYALELCLAVRGCRAPGAKCGIDAAKARHITLAVSELCRPPAEARCRDRDAAPRSPAGGRNPRGRRRALVGLRVAQ
jgi:amino acid transporter